MKADERTKVKYLDVFITRGRIMKLIANNARHVQLWMLNTGDLSGIVNVYACHGVEIFTHTCPSRNATRAQYRYH